MKAAKRTARVAIDGNCLFNKQMILLGLLPGMLLYILFRVGPSVATFVFSFTDISSIPGAAVHFIGLDNYKEILFQANARDTLQALVRTIEFSFFTTVIQTAISLFLAIILCKKFVRGKNFYRAVIFLPTILGTTVTGLCFKLFFSKDGLASSFLGLFGVSSNFFGDFNLAFKLVIFCQIWASVGYEMVIFIAGLQNIPSDLYEAASIDGANEWQAFWRVTLPQLWPTVMVNLLVCIVGSLSAFQIIMVTTGGTPQTRTLAMQIYQVAFGIGQRTPNTGRQGLASAMSMLLFVFILAATILSQYVMNKFNKED